MHQRFSTLQEAVSAHKPYSMLHATASPNNNARFSNEMTTFSTSFWVTLSWSLQGMTGAKRPSPQHQPIEFQQDSSKRVHSDTHSA